MCGCAIRPSGTCAPACAESLDNPDQRVSADCNLFVYFLQKMTLDLISSLIALVSYIVILRRLTDFVVPLTLLGQRFILVVKSEPLARMICCRKPTSVLCSLGSSATGII